MRVPIRPARYAARPASPASFIARAGVPINVPFVILSSVIIFVPGLALTVEWFRANRPWWEAIKSGEAFADYAAKNYGSRS